jgi:hypothetical protein
MMAREALRISVDNRKDLFDRGILTFDDQSVAHEMPAVISC